MAKKKTDRMVDFGAALRLAGTAAQPDHVDPTRHRQQLVADLCRMLGANLTGSASGQPSQAQPLPNLSPRMRQTLERLLAGDSEKQIAHHFGVSKHTVHVYVKALYKGFGVNSRGELLAKFVQAPKFQKGTGRVNDQASMTRK